MTKNEVIQILMRCAKKSGVSIPGFDSTPRTVIHAYNFIEALESELDEEEPWEPKEGEEVWFIASTRVLSTMFDEQRDKELLCAGFGCFPTEAAAKAAFGVAKAAIKGMKK
jgi:hypothetical protein